MSNSQTMTREEIEKDRKAKEAAWAKKLQKPVDDDHWCMTCKCPFLGNGCFSQCKGYTISAWSQILARRAAKTSGFTVDYGCR